MQGQLSPLVILLLFALLAPTVGGCGGSTISTLTPQTTASATPQPDSHTYTVDVAASTIDYVATGPFGIQFPGKFSLLGNAIVLVDESDGYRVEIDAVIDGNSVTAINGLVRDALRNSLEVDKYPTGHFVAASTEDMKPGSAAAKVQVSGTLELHGKSRAIQMEITLTIQDGKLDGTGQTDVNLPDFGVNVPTAVMNSKVTFKATIVARENDAGAGTPSATSPASPNP